MIGRVFSVVASASRPFFLMLAVVAACVVASSTSHAQDIIEEMPAAQIERIIRSFGEVKNFAETGNNTYKFEVDGLKMLLFNKSATMQLFAAFEDDVSMSSINEWNRTKRFAKAYLDNDNDPCLESDIELTGGVTEQNVKEWFKTYVLCLKGFRDHLAQ